MCLILNGGSLREPIIRGYSKAKDQEPIKCAFSQDAGAYSQKDVEYRMNCICYFPLHLIDLFF